MTKMNITRRQLKNKTKPQKKKKNYMSTLLSLEYQFDVTVSNNTFSVPRAGARSQHREHIKIEQLSFLVQDT